MTAKMENVHHVLTDVSHVLRMPIIVPNVNPPESKNLIVFVQLVITMTERILNVKNVTTNVKNVKIKLQNVLNVLKTELKNLIVIVMSLKVIIMLKDKLNVQNVM